jgi:succinate dehydrogenase flavin-adding protein (antitoxin of CptAB toxin-antitoxin module)
MGTWKDCEMTEVSRGIRDWTADVSSENDNKLWRWILNRDAVNFNLGRGNVDKILESRQSPIFTGVNKVFSPIFNTGSVNTVSFQPQAEGKETEGRDKQNNSQMRLLLQHDRELHATLSSVQGLQLLSA